MSAPSPDRATEEDAAPTSVEAGELNPKATYAEIEEVPPIETSIAQISESATPLQKLNVEAPGTSVVAIRREEVRTTEDESNNNDIDRILEFFRDREPSVVANYAHLAIGAIEFLYAFRRGLRAWRARNQIQLGEEIEDGACVM